MKYLFLSSFLFLTAVSAADAWLSFSARDAGPVVYWATDGNPARVKQVALFQAWLKKNGYPKFELRLDIQPPNRDSTDLTKKIIQGVSGVAGDIIDLGPMDLPYFQTVGLLTDVTEDAKRMGFDPFVTYPAVRPLITLDGRQYRFPCNLAAPLYWVNRKTFAKYGQPIPPSIWDFDAFEKAGKAFVAAANPPGTRSRVFFGAGVDRNLLDVLRRSAGVDIFNETLTRSALDDPRTAEILERVHQWTFKDRIIPTRADVESFAAEGGVGGAPLQLFNRGNTALLYMDRYALVELRKFGAMDLSVCELPYQEFRNTLLTARAPGIYAGSKHKDLAKLFLAFLASEDYNVHVVEDGDALPPDPKYTRIEAFLHPPLHRNEWGCHGPFAQAAIDIAIPPSISPFVLPIFVERLDREAFEGFMLSGRLAAGEVGREAEMRINKEIERTLRENPKLQPRYDELLRRQKTIDDYRASGKKIPLAWIENPFYRRYYQFKGWAE